MCMCVCVSVYAYVLCMGACVCGLRTTCGSWFSLSTMRVSRAKFKSSILASSNFTTMLVLTCGLQKQLLEILCHPDLTPFKENP